MKTAAVTIHQSQFPEKVRQDLLASLRTRKINHKFHYDSVRQAQHWLTLHQVYSPSRNDADCVATYDCAFSEAITKIRSKRVHVIGLGCGGGQKDARLLKLLKNAGREIFYTPCDVSVALALVARQTALAVLPEKNCFPLVCDLASAKSLPAIFARQTPPSTARLLTFFGMIPNFEPSIILPKLAALVRPRDFLLFSANLAPGNDYAAGLKKILPQYDNPPTRDWLATFLRDLGVGVQAGKLKFEIEDAAGLKRIVARFHFVRAANFFVGSERFVFHCGGSIRLFFSYRYTPALAKRFLARQRLKALHEWTTRSAEEGVFLCCKK